MPPTLTKRPPGLLEGVRARLEEALKSPSDEMRQFGSVLVCDDWSLSILECAYTVNELTSLGVPVVECLDIVRGPLPRNPVIYMIRCSPDAVEKVLKDWTQGNSDWTERPYAEAHIFFTSSSPQVRELTKLLASNPLLVQHLQTLKELHLEFLAPEPHLFSLKIDRDLPRFFGKQRVGQEVAELSRRVASSIVDVVVAMGDVVSVRHQQSTKCTVAAAVAREVAKQLEERTGSRGSASSRGPVLLVLDRSIDPVAPLLHELTYQAMLHDLMPNSPEVAVQAHTVPCRLKAIVRRKKHEEVVLDESDVLWCRLRHSHIADNFELLDREMKQITTKSAAAQLQKEMVTGNRDSISTSKLGDAFRDMTALSGKLKRYNIHIDLHSSLKHSLFETGLSSICDLEQSMATLENADGTAVNKDVMKKQLEETLESSRLSLRDKARLILLYVATLGGVSKEKMAKWCGMCGVDLKYGAQGWEKEGGAGVQALVESLAMLDVKVERRKWYQGKNKRRAQHHVRVEADAYDWSRFVPPVKSIVERLMQGDLAESECPHTVPEASMNIAASTSTSVATGAGRSQRRSDGSQRASWSRPIESPTGHSLKNKEGSPNALPWSLEKVRAGSNRFYVFMVGGITLSETRAIAELIASKEVEVIVGSTSILTPEEYLRGLFELERM
eukprot:Sspe_Gene.54578::Locus_30117_Transcript_2_3_Confidence_0.333_Length_2270::g.54578::m.54578/K15292/STXBP1, MUNC18-1; syntaxin-binding protein 1